MHASSRFKLYYAAKLTLTLKKRDHIDYFTRNTEQNFNNKVSDTSIPAKKYKNKITLPILQC